MFRAFLMAACLLVAGCGDVDTPRTAQAVPDIPTIEGVAPDPAAPQRLAALPAAPTDFAMPADVSDEVKEELLEAVAGSRLYSDVIRRNARSGGAANPTSPRDKARALRDLITIRDNLAALSEGGTQTYALIHTVEDGAPLKAWLISPKGGIVYDSSPEPYVDLSLLRDGLGVTRIAATQAALALESARPSEAETAVAKERDQSPEAIAKRRQTLSQASATLFPGKIADALGTRSGRLLIVPAYDTGTAPYAAFPLANGYTAENWSVIIIPGIAGLTQPKFTFDFAALNLANAVIVGDPALPPEPNGYTWKVLKGAFQEAKAVARLLDVPAASVLLREEATHDALRAALNSRDDTGLVYIAAHAGASQRDPLNNSYIAMRGERYRADAIRKERFPGWAQTNPLVVMSACQTGLGGTLPGGHFGVAQSWMAARAGQVIASLWNVDDTATRILMTEFVTQMKAGTPPELAMQRAQITTLNYPGTVNPRTGKIATPYPYANDPKMWASFAIFGKPSASTSAPSGASGTLSGAPDRQ